MAEIGTSGRKNEIAAASVKGDLKFLGWLANVQPPHQNIRWWSHIGIDLMNSSPQLHQQLIWFRLGEMMVVVPIPMPALYPHP